MNKLLLILLFLAPLFASSDEEKDMDYMYLMYADSCSNDSTLVIVWEYTGKEKWQHSVDTTSGYEVKVRTLVPTKKQMWHKEQPTWDGFKKYLDKKGYTIPELNKKD